MLGEKRFGVTNLHYVASIAPLALGCLPGNARSAVAAAAIAANRHADRNTKVGGNPWASRKPPSGAAAMPPNRPTPVANP